MALDFKTFAEGEVLTYTDLNNQFTELENKIGSMTNADVATSAEITSNKLSDAFTPCFHTITLRGHNVSAGATNNDVWGNSNNVLEVEHVTTWAAATKMRFDLPLPFKRCYLTYINVTASGVLALSNSSTADEDPKLLFGHNGVEITDLGITGDHEFYVGADSDPNNCLASPIVALQDGDYLEIAWISDASAETTWPAAESLVITFQYMLELDR